MTGVLVDSNVLIDVSTADPVWGDWSSSTLAHWADRARLVVNPLIYAEVSVAYQSLEELESFLGEIDREPLPWDAAFLAGKCFGLYRRRGGRKTSTLPDFFNGAHAAVQRYRLLTRDVRRYRGYFPTVELIAP
jgi:hypothetical protein